MKKIALVSAIALGALFTKTADAQIGINLGFHLGGHRIYAPTTQVVVDAPAEYDGSDDYYYLPDVGAYYDVADQSYYYNDGNNWVSAAYLPGYRDYDWRNFRRYEVRANRPYLKDDYYRSRFEGRVGNWGRNDEHVYADRNFRRDEHRNDDHRMDNREGWNGRDRGQTERFNTPRQFEQPQPNNGRENFNSPERQNNNFNQQSNDGRGRGNNYNGQPNMNQRGNNAPAQAAPENRGQENHEQDNRPSQPSNERGNRNGGEQHFTNNMNGRMNNRFARS